MLALIDADLVAYRCAASCKPDEPLDVALFRADKLMREIIEQVQATEYKAFLTGSENFRKDINPEYKANRKDEDRPEWLEPVREFLIEEWKAKLTHGREADDDLGIEQCDVGQYESYETIISSLDKDLRMIPGLHYSWEIGTATWTKAAEHVEVSELDGMKHFFKQMLIGDKTDNIFGIDGLGPVKSGKLINPLDNVEEMFEVVAEKYDDPKRFIMNANCLWILREGDKTWDQSLGLTLSGQYKQEQDRLSSSMKFLTEGI
jgi:5'-3' exonuclease